MKFRVIFTLMAVVFFFGFTPDDPQKLSKQLDDDNSKYTSVGNILLNVSNYGVYGNGLRNLTQANHTPSCEYPSGSGVEHLFVGGLWVGGFQKDNKTSTNKTGPFVTTAAVDASSLVNGRNSGFEFSNAKGSKVIERSTLLDSRAYNPDAISHQDFLMDYYDTSVTSIQEHKPLGIAVHQESYCWNFPFADYFVIMNYTIKNISNKYLDSIYVGLWTDAVIRNTKDKRFQSTNTAFFSSGGEGFLDTFAVAYEFDADSINVGLTDSYLGLAYLGSTPEIDSFFMKGTDKIPSTNFNSWSHSNTSDPNFFTPMSDEDRSGTNGRYSKMQGYFGATNRFGRDIQPATLKSPSNRSILISHGPYANIAPGDSINVVYAILCANKYGNDPTKLDNWEQQTYLRSNIDWARRAYFGNDNNRNGIIEPKEDIYHDGKVHRYVLPAPPSVPYSKVVIGSNEATIYWSSYSEGSVDPISGKTDFGGYRVYRTQAGFDLNITNTISNSMVLMHQFDTAGTIGYNSSGINGYNNGFSAVKLDQPVTFAPDTVHYMYKLHIPNLLNGWQYLFAVTAFDKGDLENKLDPLESSKLASLNRIIPGTIAQDNEDAEIGVYPNPYYGNAIWDGSSERLRKIYFYNLPSECDITIYTLAGDIVRRIHHDQNSNGSDQRWFSMYASDNKQKMAGGEHAWDLITGNDQAIATGLYLYTVKNSKTGKIKTGKFLVIK